MKEKEAELGIRRNEGWAWVSGGGSPEEEGEEEQEEEGEELRMEKKAMRGLQPLGEKRQAR